MHGITSSKETILAAAVDPYKTNNPVREIVAKTRWRDSAIVQSRGPGYVSILDKR